MTRRLLGGLSLALLLLAPALAHELQTNRLTLVLRERNHLSMTFFLDYPDVLHRALAPKGTFRDFALQYSAMNPQAFRKELLRAQARIQSATHLALPGGKEVTISGWTWPDPGRVQAGLQQLVMQAVVAPGDHPHEAAVEIHAEAVAPGDIASVSLRLPVELQPIVVVSYRPAQAWVKPGTPSTVITF